MATKQEIFKEKLGEYLAVRTKKEKGRILDAVCSVTGIHRKAAIRRFRTVQKRPRYWKGKRGRKPIYGMRLISLIRELWEASGRICAERLHPIMGEYIRVLKRDDMWQYDEERTTLLLKMSLGTLKDRIEKFERIKKGGGRGSTKPSHLKEIIPIRRGPWQHPPPGMGEVDTVAHCGYTLSGDFCYTVQYTDVATIWMCLAAQWNKGEQETQQSIARIEAHLPFPLLGIDPDSGSEFINWHLKGWCDEHEPAIVMTRTRPYMKNDHARIEQKNYTNVRHVVGYTRFDDPRHVVLLNELYAVLEDYINFFIPSLKCVEKARIGSRRVRKYDIAQTAYQRVLTHPDIAQDVKERLQQKYATLNPVILKRTCDNIISKLLKIQTRLR
ncbi:MAG: integrase [bacterium]|nr:integrase [bacterium]